MSGNGSVAHADPARAGDDVRLENIFGAVTANLSTLVRQDPELGKTEMMPQGAAHATWRLFAACRLNWGCLVDAGPNNPRGDCPPAPRSSRHA